MLKSEQHYYRTEVTRLCVINQKKLKCEFNPHVWYDSSFVYKSLPPPHHQEMLTSPYYLELTLNSVCVYVIFRIALIDDVCRSSYNLTRRTLSHGGIKFGRGFIGVVSYVVTSRPNSLKIM